MQEGSAVLAAASNLFATPGVGSPSPETQSFRPAGKGKSNLRGTGRVHDHGQSTLRRPP